ncbi:App1 family protein [Benzoatithermus flavus]|uniref:Phosphatase domain-containing protein n=1 Tax=Benzoatithermus flavus TaxID=3108223 RepID=A0ABU8XQB2_9PROT
MRLATSLTDAARSALRFLARPVHVVRDDGGVVLQPYRGYGSKEEIFLIGRVFREPPRRAEGAPLGSLARLGRHLFRHGIGAAPVLARFGGAEQRVVTDADGYFRIHLEIAQPPPDDRLWHPIPLELLQPVRLEVEGELFIPPTRCRSVVISDIDDTIMESRVASLPRMLWRLFLQGAHHRLAFPGMAALLRAFHRGASGEAFNPMLYVSRSPWSNYEILDEFFHLHLIPVGPLLFLREWGMTLQNPLPRRGKSHKLDMIRHMLALYRELPFVLIGDSGQRDPEIYTRLVREHPGRVLAIYIRNVSRSPERRAAIEALAAEVAAAGSSLLLAADSLAMAEHAVEHGLIAAEALAEVAAERAQEPEAPAPATTRTIVRPTPEKTRAAVERGRLDQALDQGAAGGTPPNVVVEPEDSRRL